MSDRTLPLALNAFQDAVLITVAATAGAYASKVAQGAYHVVELMWFVIPTLLLVWLGTLVIRWIIRWTDEGIRAKS